MNAGEDITITSITDSDRQNVHNIDWTAITVTKKGNATDLDKYNSGTHKISTTGLAAGVYTVTYTCPHYTGANTNHPQTWSVDFVVGNTYELTTEVNLSEVGLGGKLPVTVKKDGTLFTADAAHLYIEYPKNVDGSKVKVNESTNQIEVAADATPGTYNLCFKTEYATDGGNVIQVTVAKKQIVVKDYQHSLSTYLVKLGASPVNIHVTTPTLGANATGALSVTSATGIALSGNTITVDNTAAEGTYTVTYTVNDTRISKVVKTATFKVENTYGVTLSKNYIRRDKDRPNGQDYGSDYIMVSLFKNGTTVEATTVQSNVDITNKAGASIKTQCEFYEVSGNTIKFKVRKDVPNGTYYVVYTGQAHKVVKAKFTVQN